MILDVFLDMRMLSFFLTTLTLFAFETKADVISQMKIQSDSFISSQFNSTPQKNYQFIGAHFLNEDQEKSDFRVDIQGSYALGAPLMSSTNVRELGYIVSLGDRQKFSFGRIRDRWSEIDRRWDFGVIEPVYKWNPLNPESQGLTGLFWEVKDSGFKFSIFGSYIYLPHQGASFEIKDGTFERSNPWFVRPPESIRIFDVVSKIDYNFEKPRETDIVFQTSYGAKLETFIDSPWRGRIAAFYKPMNILALGYNGTEDIPIDRAVVQLNPQVVFHRVNSIDLAYVEKNFQFGLSALQDSPVSENRFDSKWTKPVFRDAVILSPWTEFLLTKSLKLQMQFIDVQNGQVQETGDLASPDRAAITARYPYQQAGQIGAEFRTRLMGKKTDFKVSYTASEKNQFQMVRWSNSVNLGQRWGMTTEMQLVDAQEVKAEYSNEVLQYTDNDRIAIGVTYDF